MKTWLDIDGVLHIKTENDLETYALRLSAVTSRFASMPAA
jgi:hypothetical protein